ncbi:MAG: hypothetical protein U1F31_11855 [Steroidobacteraceae bacterium]|jgi:hypothetical protein
MLKLDTHILLHAVAAELTARERKGLASASADLNTCGGYRKRSSLHRCPEDPDGLHRIGRIEAQLATER